MVRTRLSGGGGGATSADSNSATGDYSFIGGGNSNTASDSFATVSGGENNRAHDRWATVGGGQNNSAGGNFGVVAGGQNNIAGPYGMVLGGEGNYAGASFSFAGGHNAQAHFAGSFVWADDASADPFASSAGNQFSVRASGGVRFYTNAAASIGVTLTANDNTWNSVCDSTTKHNIRLVDTKMLLDKITQLPIKQWCFKGGDPNVEHISPMAQDFWNAFHVGSDSLKISTIDPSGIALAAIQELAKRCDQLEQQNLILQNQIQSLLAKKEQTQITKEK